MVRCLLLILALLQVAPEPKPIEQARDKILAAGYAAGYARFAPNLIAYYEPNTRAIFLNGDAPYWKDPESAQLFLYMDGQHSTSSRHHIIRHEIGHAVMHKKIGTDMMAYWATVYPANIDRVKSEVSEYAATNCVEFYAEVYAGLLGKKKYSPDILRAYGGLVGE